MFFIGYSWVWVDGFHTHVWIPDTTPYVILILSISILFLIRIRVRPIYSDVGQGSPGQVLTLNSGKGKDPLIWTLLGSKFGYGYLILDR